MVCFGRGGRGRNEKGKREGFMTLLGDVGVELRTHGWTKVCVCIIATPGAACSTVSSIRAEIVGECLLRVHEKEGSTLDWAAS